MASALFILISSVQVYYILNKLHVFTVFGVGVIVLIIGFVSLIAGVLINIKQSRRKHKDN
ncbi:hypothetical protein MBAV_004123 [Candidatus Magnetobacterium bavaricum]|uniref:Uncharacterized protein n=1 Tax=Candidatus Magnetobacterium bavaricum TaxID=29290 RepID=A0A0F3GSL6_9BACT|nr:hypothetical protein MBAV_004123 [Candidatus Magnetobacterium bavaricum]